MASQGFSFAPERRASDSDAPNDGPSALAPTRSNTSSSIGSARPIPPGTWTLSISGNCARCHHRHMAITIQIRASSEANHIGEIYCERCDRLWLGFGERNSTRISLISIETVEITAVESEYYSALVNLVRSAAAATVVASPGLAAIPESPTTGPSREAPIRSAIRSAIQRVQSTNVHVPVANNDLSSGDNANIASSCSLVTPQHHENNTSSNNHHTGRRSRLFTRLQWRVRRLPILRNSRFARLLDLPQQPRTSYAEQGESLVQPVVLHTTTPRLAIITPSVPIEEREPHEAQLENYTNDPRPGTSVFCGPLANLTQALGSLKSLEKSELEELSVEQRTAWLRKQFTALKASHAGHQAPETRPAMVDTTTQADFDPAELMSLLPMPPSPRDTLNGVGIHLAPDSEVSLYHRPPSINDTDISDNTAVERNTIASASPPALWVDTNQAPQVLGSPQSHP